MKSIIEKRLNVLKDLKLTYLGRSSNLFWFGFGEIIKVRQGKHKFKEVATYHLNLQCMWRLIKENTILVANMDVYSPSTESDIAIFNWEDEGANLFDQKVKNIMNLLSENVYVSGIEVTETVDLKLTFSNGWILQVFIDASNDTECWRFLKSGDLDSHMVVTGLGIEDEDKI